MDVLFDCIGVVLNMFDDLDKLITYSLMLVCVEFYFARLFYVIYYGLF